MSSAATNSAWPQTTLAPSGSTSARSSVPSASTTRSAPAAAYATLLPVGSGRGSMTAPAAASSRVSPVVRSQSHNRPDSANEASRPVRSVANATTPAPDSRLRSRRARSSAESSSPPPSRASGSARHRSAWSSTSKAHSDPVRDVPDGVRTNSTRDPSAVTASDRGTPRAKRWVRAYSRGNDVVSCRGSIGGMPRSCQPGVGPPP